MELSAGAMLILELVADFGEAERRAETRPVYLTPEEFRVLHEQQADFTAGQVRLDTTRLSIQDAAARVKDIWLSS
ncbi:hypothetical protein [Nonomuraea sp. NPDC052265]|uniref:hypothetical protein n=1 Tax=Nonomuraea sp. NPDC052265 TaxID=3364374 RepID=UPI0037CAD7DC